MTPDERIMNQFHKNTKACPKGKKKPRLFWDHCWVINCEDGCSCQMSDGDNSSSTPILVKWKERRSWS